MIVLFQWSHANALTLMQQCLMMHAMLSARNIIQTLVSRVFIGAQSQRCNWPLPWLTLISSPCRDQGLHLKSPCQQTLSGLAQRPQVNRYSYHAGLSKALEVTSQELRPKPKPWGNFNPSLHRLIEKDLWNFYLLSPPLILSYFISYLLKIGILSPHLIVLICSCEAWNWSNSAVTMRWLSWG